MRKITLDYLQSLQQNGEKITALTAYDATFSRIISESEIELMLVGDTLGMVVRGLSSTLPVTVDDICYHTQCVAQGNTGTFLIGDLPFASYATVADTLRNAARVMQAGAMMVKMEGGSWLSESVRALAQIGIPVCGHLGLTPQSVHSLSGYKVQGRAEAHAKTLLSDAIALEQAGMRLLVLECVPRALAAEIARSVTIPVIGIGAGPECDGQILVTYDMLGLHPGKPYTFVQNFMEAAGGDIAGALQCYRDAVKKGTFPLDQHSFS